jgi:hypothetical protein
MKETTNYIIKLYGSSDSTEFEMQLTEEEYKLLEKVAKKSKETPIGWEPTMEIEKSEGDE